MLSRHPQLSPFFVSLLSLPFALFSAPALASIWVGHPSLLDEALDLEMAVVEVPISTLRYERCNGSVVVIPLGQTLDLAEANSLPAPSGCIAEVTIFSADTSEVLLVSEENGSDWGAVDLDPVIVHAPGGVYANSQGLLCLSPPSGGLVLLDGEDPADALEAGLTLAP